jgi:DNA-binding MarR family transcriptional regulator
VVEDPETQARKLPPALTDWMGFLLNKAAQSLLVDAEEELEPVELEAREVGLLLLLEDEGPQPQIQLASKLRIDRTTMVDLIDDLESQALVNRRPNPEDRRAYAVTLTDEGRSELRDATRTLAEVEESFLSPLDEEEQAALRRLLLRLTGPSDST